MELGVPREVAGRGLREHLGERAFERVREVLAPFPDSPERQDAVRLAADRLGLPVGLQAGAVSAAPLAVSRRT